MRAVIAGGARRFPSLGTASRALTWVGLIVFAGSSLLLGTQAHAQSTSMTDVVKVTVGGTGGPAGAGYRDNGLDYGSASPTVTANGYPYLEIADNGYRAGKGGIQASANIQIGGLTSDPGQSWLTSVSALGVTLSSSSASKYTYSAGVASWIWTGSTWGLYEQSTGAAVQVSVVHGAPPIGYLDLKYVVVGIDYAPPGAKSSVTYTNSTIRGTAATDSSSYKTSISVTDTADIGADIFGIASGGVTETSDIDYSQMSGTNSSVTVTNTDTSTDIVPGPASSSAGVDHDYDVIWVWLNPAAGEYVGSSTVSFTGYGYNAEDDYAGAEVVPIQVLELENPSLMSSGLKDRLARGWDTSGVGGLTSTDYANIAALDPFIANSSYNPTTDATHRFQAMTDTTVPYVPAAPGGQPVTTIGSFATQTATSTSQSAQTQYSVGFSFLFGGGINFFATYKATLKVSTTYTVTDMWSSAINSTIGKTASYSITGPASSDNYTGPVSFQVYRDNVYGSFMFFPLE